MSRALVVLVVVVLASGVLALGACGRRRRRGRPIILFIRILIRRADNHQLAQEKRQEK
jgi:hypothetical protein